MGGCVSYSNQAKMDILGVKPETLEAHGAVSEQTAIEMAEGCARVFGTDCAISTTGIAGPGGGTPDKPVGLVRWVCLARWKQDLRGSLVARGRREDKNAHDMLRTGKRNPLNP